MAELADAGAAGLSDDGLPIRSARVMRRALQYQRLAGLPDRRCTRRIPSSRQAARCTRATVSAALGIGGIPSISESTMIARDCALAALRGGADPRPAPLGRRVGGGDRARPRRPASRITCEATPHHLTLTDEEVRSLDSRFKMNPPLRAEADRQALIEGIRSGAIDCIATDHAPAHLRREGGPVRAGGDGRDRARDRVRRRSTPSSCCPGVLELATVVERLGGGAEAFGFEPPRIAPGAEAQPRRSVDLDAEWEAGAEGWESRSDNSCFAGRRLRGRVLMTVAGGPGRLPAAQLRAGGRVAPQARSASGRRWS